MNENITSQDLVQAEIWLERYITTHGTGKSWAKKRKKMRANNNLSQFLIIV